MNAMSKSTKSGGCGCGGGAGSKSGGCGCGGGQTGLCACGDVGCATCRNQGFVRPRFFAGQLLTEEDLQKLIDYVVAKNRLHNQRLWGDGVVCGLEVTCHPCGGGTVVVNPGYALDCCGNDLLLGCPEELDINAMVRDLKRNLLGGIDCGDPCPPKKKEPKDAGEKDSRDLPAPQTGSNVRVIPSPTEPDDDQKEPVIDTTRHYCLYIRYCENLTDPVSPYATDEGCSYQSCQPTRVSEGVTFELRCDEGCGHQKDIRDRICECIGDLDSARQSTTMAKAFYSLNRLVSPIRNLELNDHRRAAQNFVTSVENVRNIPLVKQPQAGAVKRRGTAAITPSPAGGAGAEGGGLEQPKLNTQEFENWLSDIHTANAHLASWYLARGRGGRTGEGSEADKSGEEVNAARIELRNVAAKVNEQVNAISAPKLALEYYSSFLKRTIELAASEQPLQQFGEARLLMVTKGSIFERQDLQSSVAPMMALREELLDRLDRSPRVGDCRLLADVLAIRPPDLEALTGWQKASSSLPEAWDRYLMDCFCAAFNPPCGPCDDPAVLLACLEVKDCEVIEICNLKRKFVISPSALRYWLPPLNYLGELLEKLCCPEPLCEEEDVKPSDPKDQLLGLSRYKQVTVKPKFSGRIDPDIFELLCGSSKRDQYLANRFTKARPVLTSPLRADLSGSLKELLSVVVSRIGQPFATPAVPLDKPVGEILRDAVIGDKAALATFIGALEPEVRRSFAATLKTEEGKAGVRALITELQPGPADTAAIGKKLEELSTAVSKEGLSERLAEAVKAKGGATGTAISSLADERVAAAVQKLNLGSAAKDLKEVKRIRTENAELKKNLTALEARLKKLEGGTPS